MSSRPYSAMLRRKGEVVLLGLADLVVGVLALAAVLRVVR
jgi:hypothetical protein